MGGTERRRQILNQLLSSEKPISATAFAQAFHVSRQIIVGDVALLRASGDNIIATARGYILQKNEAGIGILKRIVCRHTAEQTREELEIIVALGGEIVDVSIEHPIYGELTGNLFIKNEVEIDSFLVTLEENKAELLSVLTDGIHLHTIRCRDEQTFQQIEQALNAKNILYKN